MTTYKDIDYILEHLPDNLPYKGVIKRVLIQAPAADVKPNIKGYWIKTGQSFIYPDKFICYSCSECGYDIEKTKFNYCPNCGAKMEGQR